MRRKIFLADAFTTTLLDGNPAGVLPDAEGLTDALMQRVAREVNASETAFVFPAENADFRLRFFTPAQEVPFCGHAFVAAMTVLKELGRISTDGEFSRLVVETGAGRHPTDLVRQGAHWRIELTQAEPAFRPNHHPADAVCSALGMSPGELASDLPLEFSYTGLWHLIVPLADEASVIRMRPRFETLAALTREMGVDEVHVFAKRARGYRCRGFAPSVGINEDPVTGSASGALGAYLVRHGVVPPGETIDLEQRGADGRGGTVRVVVHGTPKRPERVVVGGYAVVSVRGEIELDG
jgi:PhzF family phenazine biosynthesis protein